MKRFRVFPSDFDTRVHSLTMVIQDHWSEHVKELHSQNREKTQRELVFEFGELDAETKRANFIDIEAKPLSILAFHNLFLEQIRVAFVMGGYYPALTSACALGERMLNYVTLSLRDDFRHTPQYKRVYNKDSFDNWDLAIDTLEAWGVLIPEVALEFRSLARRRNDSLHFRPEVDKNDRSLALAAIKSLQLIVVKQFGGFGQQPWFLGNVPGESYIKKEWESKPFIRKIYLPNCMEVGPRHRVTSVIPWAVEDEKTYEENEVSDEEFCVLRKAYLSRFG